MSKTVPTIYEPPSLVSYSAGEQILYPQPRELVRGIHHLWSRRGHRVPLLLKTLNPFETTSASHTQTDEGPDSFDLDRLNPIVRLLRPVLVAGVLSYQIVVRVYGRDFVMRTTVYSPDAAGVITTAEVTRLTGAGWGWSSATITFSRAQVGEGGVAGAAPRVLGLSLEAHRSTTKAELWQAWAHEPVAVAAALPSGA